MRIGYKDLNNKNIVHEKTERIMVKIKKNIFRYNENLMEKQLVYQ